MRKLFASFLNFSPGFTMIELLIVITILGILAVAVLSAINPIEQINRGRDTGSKSDAEQLLSAIDRYNAFKGYYPWQASPASDYDLTITRFIEGAIVDDSVDLCPMEEKLGTATTANCVGTDELKVTFFNRVQADDYNHLWVYNRGTQGDSTYVCFVPQSQSFLTEAQDRCNSAQGLPSDLADIETTICGGCGENGDDYCVCLP